MPINFKKMHGLGNDFVIFDGRESRLELTPDQIRYISDRKRGVGCDLIALMKYSKNQQGTTFIHLYNSDGSEIEACGNVTRCVADVLMTEGGTDSTVIETLNGALNCWKVDEGLIKVAMGVPKLAWQKIPLSKKCDTLHLPLEGDPVAVNIGNPHCVFFVDDMEQWDDERLEREGNQFVEDPLFPRQTNVEVVEVLSRTHLRMRVRERGCGITEACGSAACGVAVAAIRRGLTERKMTITLDGGDLILEWSSDDASVHMTGPVAYVFDGELNL